MSSNHCQPTLNTHTHTTEGWMSIEVVHPKNRAGRTDGPKAGRTHTHPDTEGAKLIRDGGG